eukprot:1905647-Pyramimonas_sp.AAC.1
MLTSLLCELLSLTPIFRRRHRHDSTQSPGKLYDGMGSPKGRSRAKSEVRQLQDFAGRLKLVSYPLPAAGVSSYGGAVKPTRGTVPLPCHLERHIRHVTEVDQRDLKTTPDSKKHFVYPCPMSLVNAVSRPTTVHSSRDKRSPSKAASRPSTSPEKARRPNANKQPGIEIPEVVPFVGRESSPKVYSEDWSDCWSPSVGNHSLVAQTHANQQKKVDQLFNSLESTYSGSKKLFDSQETGLRRACTSHGYRIFVENKPVEE